MGGITETNEPITPSGDFCIMDRKPILTYAGDRALFSSLEKRLTQGIPQEATEWKRSYGRPPQSVYTEASFIPFRPENIPREGDWHLIRQPIFHTYWTECADVDAYKNSVKEDIDAWLKILHKHGIEDWLIVQVETYDIKRSNKLLPRTTVLDKIRSDFASKHPDRCMSVINPIRSESKSAETWRGLLYRIRVLLLQAFDTTLVKFEETIRKQRERRTENGWNFCNYFLLQEELAFVLEMLGLYKEALIQYDELDALFGQFVLNSCLEETPRWLNSFQTPLEKWPGLQLTHRVYQEHRLLLQNSQASLLQFRSYLFSRQCAMLLLTFQPWEIARRTLSFLHNCVTELRILEVACSPGSVSCWIFLACLEVLRTCGQFSDSIQVQKYSRFTASLWAYASEKLHELGELCGLLPGMSPTSEQLHLVVVLSSGMGDGPVSKEQTPTDQLKEALSSTEAFKKHYLEFAELAVGTYKHIGRVRLARLIGRNLAAFHKRLGDYQKASLYLDAALHMLEVEGWKRLAVETRQELAECYLHTEDKEKFIKTCVALASSKELTSDRRLYYFSQMTEILQSLKSDSSLLTPFYTAFKITSIEVQPNRKKLVPGGVVEVAVELLCLLPCPVECTHVSLAMEKLPFNEELGEKKVCSSSLSCDVSGFALTRSSFVDTCPTNPLLAKLSFSQLLEYQQDQSLKAAKVSNLESHDFLRRTSSSNHQDPIPSQQGNSNESVSLRDTTLSPGGNLLLLQSKVMESGQYQFSHISIKLYNGTLDFFSPPLSPPVGFSVTSERPSVSVLKGETNYLAGIEQEVVLSVSTGSNWIPKDTKLVLRTSNGLQTQLTSAADQPWVEELEILLPDLEPYQTIKYSLRVFSILRPQTDNSLVEHELQILTPWSDQMEKIVLQFQPPFYTSFRLHTSYQRKFAQVAICGLAPIMFALEEPHLKLCNENTHLRLIALNPHGGQPMIVGGGSNVYLLWELDSGDEKDEDYSQTLKTELSLAYRAVDSSDTCKQHYQCLFDIADYKTLLIASAKVEPSKGSEFCRAGAMSHLHLTLERVSESLRSSLMYEVLVDQTMWAVCGRTTGVVTLEESSKQTVLLDVMPLTSGYLPVPHVRLSKYIPADHKPINKSSTQHPRREPFSPGQVFINSKALQIHVLPSVPPGDSP